MVEIPYSRPWRSLDGQNYLSNGTTQQPDLDGQVSSIRFELLREGLEDYEYLWMLNEAGDKEFADEQVRNLVIDVSSFSRNVDPLYLTRKTMALRLEKLAGKK
ncbi:MAG: hypothetical protein WA874_03825 [Chryseosolibacter sp.]